MKYSPIFSTFNQDLKNNIDAAQWINFYCPIIDPIKKLKIEYNVDYYYSFI